MSRMDAEILVHITASSSAADDTGYRALASAYLAFQPASRTSLSAARPGPDTHASAVIESPRLSFVGAIHNLNSPSLFRRTEHAGADVVPSSQASWQTPASVVSDSYPDNNISLALFSSPTRIFEQLVQPHSSQSEGSAELAPREAGWGHGRNAGDSEVKPGGGLEVSICDISAVFDSQGAPSDVPGPATETAEDKPPSLPPTAIRQSGSVPDFRFDLNILSEPEAPELPLPRADSEPPLRKRQRTSSHLETAQGLARSSSDIGPQSKRVSRDQTGEPTDQCLTKYRDASSIHAPQPSVSCLHLSPQSLITVALAKLATDLDMARRFRPASQVRELRPCERGYWLLDCTGWATGLPERAWSYLGNYVGSGHAGWGVWCTRDEARRWIRLYCWGCVVGHTHLLLYLASEREVLHTGSRWIDGEGKVCIEMGAKDRR